MVNDHFFKVLMTFVLIVFGGIIVLFITTNLDNNKETSATGLRALQKLD